MELALQLALKQENPRNTVQTHARLAFELTTPLLVDQRLRPLRARS